MSKHDKDANRQEHTGMPVRFSLQCKDYPDCRQDGLRLWRQLYRAVCADPCL